MNDEEVESNNKKGKIIIKVKNDEPKEVKNNKNNFSFMKKKLKKYDELSKKFDSLLNNLNPYKLKKQGNKNNKSDNAIILEKERQIKNDSIMIHSLRKDKNKLEEEIELLKKVSSPSEYNLLMDQISLKNIEIEKLNKKIKEFEKNYKEMKNENIAFEKKNRHLEDLIIRLKNNINNLENKINKNKAQKEERKKKIINNEKTRKNKLLRSFSQLNIEKFNEFETSPKKINENFYHLLNDKEKSCLKNLFGSNEEYTSFGNKLNIINSRNIKVENQLKIEIENLNKIIMEKEKVITDLNKRIEIKEITIKALEKKLNKIKINNEINKSKQIKLLTIEELLKEIGIKTNFISNKDKFEKIKILLNHYKEELNKMNIENCRLNEMIKNYEQIIEVNK